MDNVKEINFISPHYRSDGRRQGSGAIFLGEIGNLKYEKVTRIFKESYTHHVEKFITLTIYYMVYENQYKT